MSLNQAEYPALLHLEENPSKIRKPVGKQQKLRKRKVIVNRKSRNSGKWGRKISTYCGRFWNGAAVVKHLPVGKYAIAPTKYLSKSTQFAIIDTTAKSAKKANWVLRLDNPHKGVDFSHVNVNPKLTGFKDPHAKIPDGVVSAASGTNKALRVVGTAALVLSIVIDTIRIGSAVRSDVKKKGKPGKETGKTVASVGSAYAGGAAGAFGGNALGGWIGGGIGALFGGVGAVPGAAIGSIVGGLIGGVGGAIGSSIAAEKAVDELVSDSDDYEDIKEENDVSKPSDKTKILKKRKDRTERARTEMKYKIV
jgi:hypothetical protein